MNYHDLVRRIAEEFDIEFTKIMSITIDAFSVTFELIMEPAQTDYKGNPKTYTERYLHDEGIHR
jgi:hypothetical protein